MTTRRVAGADGLARRGPVPGAGHPGGPVHRLGHRCTRATSGRSGSCVGWGEARFGDGPAAVAFFYLTNLGIPFVLAVVAAFTARGLPGRWFLVAWMVALFIVPNVVVVSAVEFDMNKYFQIMWIAVAILAGWLIARWPTALVAAVLLVCALSPVLIAVWHMRSDDVALGLPQETAARWIAANTPERSVFVTDDFINSPVDLAGRLRITTFGPYVSNLGYDPAPREADTKRDLLRRAGGRRRADGQVRRDLRAVEWRRPVRRRCRHGLLVEPAVRDGLRRGRGHGLAAGRARRAGPPLPAVSPWARRRS